MAAAEGNLKGDWKKRESFGSAMAQIGVVALVLAAGVWFFYQRNTTKKDVSDKLREARLTAIRNNPADLNKALTQLDEVFKLDANSPEANALAAAIHVDLWVNHRVAGADAKAREFLAKAEKGDARTEDRYGAKALLLVNDGKAKEAEEYIEELRKKGASAAKLFLAQGLAHKQLGNLALARTALSSAIDKAWKDPQYSSAYGESLLEEGSLLQGLDALNKALGANPDHIRARIDTALGRMLRRHLMKEAADTVVETMGRPEAELTPGLRARTLAVKALVHNVEEKWDDAVKASDDALAMVPSEPWALYAKAQALSGKKDAGAAGAWDALVKAYKTSPFFYVEGANALLAMGNFQAGLALLDGYEAVFKGVMNPQADGTAVSALERDDRYWLARGDLLRSAGKEDEALGAYDRAIAAKNVNLVKAYYAKGSIYLGRKDFPKAKEMLEPITPPDGTGQVAEAYMAMGHMAFDAKEWGPGCQSYAYALTRFKTQGAPREQLNTILSDVEKKLKDAKQKEIAKLWMQEAKPLIQ